jgi:4-hydroxy-2-oxoheptanedioate aldolase
MVSLMGVDCIWIDMEHHATSVETANQMMRAARVGTADIMARPGKGEFMRMGRMLEAGATGILYPRCDDAVEAKEVVRWAKFAPLGERGADTSNPDNPYVFNALSPYTKHANEETFVAIQIESPSAAKQAGAIASVEGVDMLFFGPADYGLLSGAIADDKPERVREAIDQVCKDTIAAGKVFSTLAFNYEDMQHYLDIGAKFVSMAQDLMLVRAGLDRLKKKLTPMGFEFE